MANEKKEKKKKKEKKRKYRCTSVICVDVMKKKLKIIFDSKKCILLQHTCGISIATMIASEKGWGAGAGVCYSSTRRIRIQQRKKYTHISCDNNLFAYRNTCVCRVVAFFSFFPFFFSFFFFFFFSLSLFFFSPG